MNALIDTESKSYREGYTKTECYGYADLCTYFIDSQAKFDTWVANTAGNDYSHIIIKGGCGSGTSGAYETTTTINLTTTGTKTIQGVNNATISSTNDVKYDTIPTTADYWIRDLNLNGCKFFNCTNLITCTGIGSTTGFYLCTNLTNCSGSGTISGISSCTNLTNCSGNSTGYGFYICNNLTNCTGSGTIGFYNCVNLTNCIGKAEATGDNNAYGFDSCAIIINCLGVGINTGTGTGTGTGYGFYSCVGVSHCVKYNDSTTATFDTTTCCANIGAYNSTYKVANTANGGFNDLT